MAEPSVAPEPAGTISLRLPDADHGLAGVRLEQDVGLPGERLEFRRTEDGWLLEVPAPNVLRLEYKLVLRHHDGGTETITDPTNPLLAPGAFGDKSVLELPGYTAPGWLGSTAARNWSTSAELTVHTPAGEIDLLVRSPGGPADRVLLVHDGPEFDQLAGLGRFAAEMVATGRVPPFHLVLLAPGARDERYSANPGYASALIGQVLPEVHAALGTTGPVVLLGASLGGLAALHVQRRHPAAFSALFLQSASFFTPTFDECESGYRYFRRITRYVASVHRARRANPVPVTLTCGTVEENLRNNQAMAATLSRQGYPVRLHVVPDAHNYTAWRDGFDPYLVDLLARVWAGA